MTWTFSIYVIILLSAFVVAVTMAVIAWRRRRAAAGVAPFIGVMAAVAWWSLLYGLELASDDPVTMRLLIKFEYFGIPAVSVCWFLFVLQYTGRLPLIRPRLVLQLSIIPAITVLAAFTNDWHHLLWSEMSVLESAGMQTLKVAHGSVFFMEMVYSYLLLGYSSVIMLSFLWRSRAVYRWQAWILFSGVVFPWVGNAIYLIQLENFPNVDLTPLFFSISGVLLVWGAFRFQLLDVVPVARRAVVDGMSDVVLVLDLQWRVVDANPAAEALLRVPLAEILGRTLNTLLPEQDATIAHYRDVINAHDELSLQLDGEARVYDLRLSPLYAARGQLSGRLLVLRDITERKRLETSLAQQMEHFEQLLAVARATTSYPTLDATLGNTLDIAVALTHADRGSIILVDGNNKITHSILARGDVPVAISRSLMEQVLDHGLIGWVLSERELALIEDTDHDARWLAPPEQPFAVGSVLGVPIIHLNVLLGVLILIHPERRHFTERDADIMTAAAQQMGLAIRNAMIYEEQRRMANQQTTLYEMLRTLQHPQEPSQMAQLSVRTIVQLTGWGFVGLLEPDKDSETLKFIATAGQMQLQLKCMLSTAEGIMGEVWQSGQLKYVPDIHQIADTTCEASSLLLVPLKPQGRVQQLLYIASDKPAAFDTDDHLLAKSLADVITLALQNARLYTELQHNLQRTDSLYRLSRSLVARRDLQQVLEAAVNGAVTALQADRASLITLDLENQQVLDFLGAGPGHEQIITVSFEELMAGLTGWAVRHKGPVLSLKHVPDPRESPAVRERRQETQVGSIVVVPLIFADTVYGTITALNRPEQRNFTQEDLRVLSAIAAQVVVAIRNLRLFENVAEEQRRLQALVQSTYDGIALIGMDRHVLVANHPMLLYLGLEGTPEDWVGYSLDKIILDMRRNAPMAARTLLHELRRVQRGDEPPGQGEYQIGARILEWFNLPVMHQENPLGRLVILRDVTEARMVEKLRNDLTHTMVHDLRNPLTGIFGALRLLSRRAGEELPSHYLSLLQIAQSSAQHMLDLVNSILDISRLESGHMPLNLTAFSPHSLADEVLALEQPLAEEKTIVLTNAVPEETPQVTADRKLLARVLQNLMGNALKFTPETGSVTVSAEVARDTPDKLLISVTDTGPGIPPELQGRLFQKFVTGDYEGRGSGLGLTFCRMVVEAHGEKIWLSSPPGKGATFIFALPLATV